MYLLLHNKIFDTTSINISNTFDIVTQYIGNSKSMYAIQYIDNFIKENNLFFPASDVPDTVTLGFVVLYTTKYCIPILFTARFVICMMDQV